ncbi:MAG: protein translocase subunit SecD [Anaerolineae bacterium]
MSQRNIILLVLILLLAAFVAVVDFNTLEYNFPQSDDLSAGPPPWWADLLFWQGDQQRSIMVHRGLDLEGGTQVVLEAEQIFDESTGEPIEITGDTMEGVRRVIENRVSGGLGVVEPLVQVQGERRIVVELPGISDPERAIATLRETGRLEFVEALQTRLFQGDRIATSEAVRLEGSAILSDTALAFPGRVFDTVMTGAHLEDANVATDPNTNVPYIAFRLTEEGGDIFSRYTREHIGDILAIVLDGEVLSAPAIQSQIGREGRITGQFDVEEAQDIVIKLRYGALPLPLKVVENRTIGPTLGQDSVQKSIRAGIIGLIVVFLFMLIYYRLPGFLAVLALVIYVGINFAVYKLLPVTLTLPAITGFILSTGMAVDANILVFERLKEELRAGKSLRYSTEAGFSRAWTSIRDSNLSTLITCAILFWFGSNFGASIVKGFAVTLALGVVINIFTAITVTRTFVRFVFALMGDTLMNSPFLLGVRPGGTAGTAPGWVRNAFNLVRYRKIYFAFSTVVILLGLAAMGYSTYQIGTPLKFGIDFTGGAFWEIGFEQPIQPETVRRVFTAAGHADVTVQTTNNDQTAIIRTRTLDEDEKVAIGDSLAREIGPFEELRFESVGPIIGREVTRAASIAVLAASIAILFFIWLAFRAVTHAVRYGISAIAAEVHDVLVTAGLFSVAGLVLGWEVDTLFLTAILTVIGFSVQDSIVVFDRVRENLPRYKGEDYETIVNRSLLETLHRSLATQLNAIFVLIAILFFGGATTKQFIAVLLIGLLSGTYSSIFNAVPLLVAWQKGEIAGLFGRFSALLPSGGRAKA